MRQRHHLAGPLLVGMLLGGCAAAPSESGVSESASALITAVQAGDGPRACAVLAPQAVQSLESGDKDCAAAVKELKLPGGPARDLEVWGDRARVRLGDDTVFLARFPGGWRVTAAGCRPQPKGPYDCEVEA